MKQFGKLIIITGATVSGKDTVVAALLKAHPSWKKVVTTTTRPIRPGEIDGEDYYFISVEAFQEMKEKDEFLETVEYAGNNYGTTKSTLDPVFQGHNLIWRIDASRSSEINKLFDNCFDKETAQNIKANTKVIYLKLPDDATRQKHFLKRGMEKSDIAKRIKQDEIDWDLGKFENIVINYDGQLNKTIEEVERIINYSCSTI